MVPRALTTPWMILRRAGLPPLAEALIVSVAEVFAPPTGPAEAAGPVQVPPAVRKAWAEATQAVEAARAWRCRRAPVCRRFFQVGRYVLKRLPIHPPGG